jgi:triosephosphate isomerase
MKTLDKCVNEANEHIVFAPATALKQYKKVKHITLGAQNAYPVENGAYTGEIGLDQLNEFDIKTILIGHSERRHILGETQEEIARKFAFFQAHGFRIVYCIGEPLEIRQEGEEALEDYIDAQLVGIDLAYENLVVAYEPVWAIGTGVVATPQEIASMFHYLAAKIDKPLLYGGSVKLNNIQSVLETEHCEGVLVGSASLDVDDFCKMANS